MEGSQNNFWQNYYENQRNEELYTYQAVLNFLSLLGISFKYP